MSDSTPLTFTANIAGSTVKLITNGSLSLSDMYYRRSSQGAWNAYTIGDTITLSNSGDIVQFWHNAATLSTSTSKFVQFVMTGSVSGSGDCQSLLNYSTSCTAYCFSSLFAGCTALTTSPQLSATSLANYCYYNTFKGCSSLLSTPVLPATTLKQYCYAAMFKDCTSLITQPQLPATTLDIYCYYQMFRGCTSLVAAVSVLPATTLKSYCYYNMFKGCTALTKAPKLPAVQLVNNCYRQLFQDCINLTYVEVGFTDWNGTAACTTDWLSGVSATGTFTKPIQLPTQTGTSRIPIGWKVQTPPLTFTANTAGSTVTLTQNGTLNLTNLYYRLSQDDEWLSYTPGTTITLSDSGDIVQFKNTSSTLSTSVNNYAQFVMTGSIAASGNTMSLLNFSNTVPTDGLRQLFRACTALTTPPQLPALILGVRSYMLMFYGCTSLVLAPELPATDLWGRSTSCYQSMFAFCTTLTKAPALPAPKLQQNCYMAMFTGCTSLTQAPQLPAKTLTNLCYRQMFQDTAIRSLKVGFTDWSSSINATQNWLLRVPDSGTLIKPRRLPKIYGNNNIPTGWRVQNSDVPECTQAIPFKLNPMGIEVKEQMPLTLTAQQANSTVKLTATGSPTVSGLYYRQGKSGTWLPYTIDQTITLANTGDSVQFWNSMAALGNSGSNYCQFALTGKIAAKGNTNSLINWSQTCSAYCFANLFYGCGALLQASLLPSVILANYCYSAMYRDTSITKFPQLPATVLKFACYNAFCMGTKVAGQVDLVGVSSATSCYNNTLRNTLISKARLQLTSLGDYSITRLFSGCSKLAQIQVNFTSWRSGASTQWVSGVAPGGTFIKPQALPQQYGVDKIPQGWTVINK